MKFMRRLIRNLVILLLAVILIAGSALAYSGYRCYRNAVTAVSIPEAVAAYADLPGTVSYKQMDEDFVNAVVAVEDKRFYDHEGVDWKRTFSAFLNTFVNLYGGTQGGSTITQQLVKNLTGDDDQTASRKIQEIVRARNLESQYPKSTILECYINTVHFGNGCDGIETAAYFYFGKDASDLTLLECASLAATIQSPSVKNPLDGPEENKDRREFCLREMLDQGSISKEEYDAAMADTLTVNSFTPKMRAKKGAILSSRSTR